MYFFLDGKLIYQVTQIPLLPRGTSSPAVPANAALQLLSSSTQTLQEGNRVRELESFLNPTDVPSAPAPPAASRSAPGRCCQR